MVRLRAAAWGVWRSRLAAGRTRSRPSGVPERELLGARATEGIEPRPRRATSLIVAATYSPQQPRCRPSRRQVNVFRKSSERLLRVSNPSRARVDLLGPKHVRTMLFVTLFASTVVAGCAARKAWVGASAKAEHAGDGPDFP